MKRVIMFVCKGNIHRSVLAEICLRQELENLGLSNKFEVMSRGIQGCCGTSMSKYANMTKYEKEWLITKPILEKLCIDLSGIAKHAAQSITLDDVKRADVVYAMQLDVLGKNPDNLPNSLLNQFPEFSSKMNFFGEIDGSSDELSDCGGSVNQSLHLLVNERIVNGIRKNVQLIINNSKKENRRMKNVRANLVTYARDTYLMEDKQRHESSLPVIDCEVGYSPFGCSEKMLESIGKFDFSQVARYSEMFYAKLLKPMIVERFSGANLNPSNIFFGHGSFNLAERLIHKFIVPKSMLGYGPQFNEIPTEMEAAGGDYRPIPLTDDFQFPLNEILAQLNGGKDSILYLDNPNNPTGHLISLENIECLVQEAEKNEIIVLVDEAYGDFVVDEFSAINLVCKYSNLIVIRSFSKALGLAAQRIGYMTMSNSLAPYFSKVDVPFEPTLVSAVMASAVLSDWDFISRVRKASHTTKEKICSAIISKGLEILPTHPDVSILMAHKSGVNLFAQFQKIGIRVENGAGYGKTNKIIDHSFIRLRVPSEAETADVVKRIMDSDFE